MRVDIIVIAILVIVAVTGAAYFNGRAEDRQEIIEAQAEKIHALETEVYYANLPVEYVSPLKSYWISSLTGYRTDPMGGGEERLHKGVDLTAARGTEVVAVMDGVVAEHWPAPDGFYVGHPVYGGLVVLEHHGFYSLYGLSLIHI